MAQLKLAAGADHAGFALKQEMVAYLRSLGHEVTDYGTHTEQSVDYPDFAHPVASAVEKGEVVFGLLVCGSGNGISMAANKHAGIRAALCWKPEIAELARLHNDANILSLPARFISVEEAKACINIFLNTAFEGGRHANRVNKISC
ncbi:MAG: ribose 5-phosphate isomerase B [Bacteroidetes bacterium]|nr:ribose 5-phosphate isomerase B [Bacteroidota bacterium]